MDIPIDTLMLCGGGGHCYKEDWILAHAKDGFRFTG